MKTLACLLLGFIFSDLSYSQSKYQIGTSNVSLEPDSSIFSLALAGYGFPREGRFSITWNYLDSAENISALTGYKEKLYAVSGSGNLLEGIVTPQAVLWKIIGKSEGATALSIANNTIYAIKNGELWGSAFSCNKISFKKISRDKSFTALTSLHNKLYAAVNNDDLLEGSIINNKISWEKIGSAPHIVSMASFDNKIYALNSGDTLWSAIPRKKKFLWIEIGRNNSVTFTIDLKQIAVTGNRLYGISADRKIYKAAQNTNNDLSARAIAIKKKNKTVVLVGLDLTGFNLTLIDEIKQVIYKKRGISPSAILINASHTHFAPVTQAWTTWGEFYHVPDSNYLNRNVKKAVIRCIENALDNMVASTIYFGRGTTNIGRNRRGTATRIKPYDPTLDVLKIESENKRRNAILFMTGCHPVFKNAGKDSYTLSANYPGIAKSIIEKKTNSAHAIFIEGCAGDVDPQSDNHIKTGEDLSADVLNVLNKEMTKLDGDISYAFDKMLIPVRPWSIDSIINFRKINAAIPGDLQAEKNVRWCDLMLGKYKRNAVDTTLSLYIQTINIGDWKLVGLSREAVNEYGPAIRNIWPDKIVSVAGYCNDVSSYLPINWHIQEQTYEGLNSFLWYGQPGIPPANVLDIIIDKIRSFNR